MQTKMILRVPGIGVKSVEIILAACRYNRLRDVGILRKMGIQVERAVPLFYGMASAAHLNYFCFLNYFFPFACTYDY